MKLRCEHVIRLDAGTFWAHIHDPEYEARVAEATGLDAYREVERSETEDAVYRRIEGSGKSPENLAALLRRVGGPVEGTFVEEQWRSKTDMRVRWKMRSPFLPERVTVEGEVRVEPIDERSCRRILEGVVEVRVPIVGRLIERVVVDRTVYAYGRAAELARGLGR